MLDEPTTGVDAVSRKEFWDILQKLKQQGITILVSTPYMDEANLCERIALIQNGKIMSVDTPQNIMAAYPVKLFAVRSAEIYRLLNDCRNDEQIETCYAVGEFLHVTVKGNPDNAAAMLKEMVIKKCHTDFIIKPIAPVIEDSFIRLMNKTATAIKNAVEH